MHKKFDHGEIEKKWQNRWAESELYRSTEDPQKPKKYILDMFPYPSGEGLHVGHPKGYIATDIYSRYSKMNGYEVLHPMGWDAFGLPAENFAIKHKVHPRVAVEKNVKRFKEQLSILGFNYDWDREINTTDPAYYKWTQWIFLQLFKKGLAYQSYEPINWCPSCQTGLANEDLDNGVCERCDSPVEKRPMRQWVLKIREYADRMLEDLDTLTWPEHIKEAQRNWIGKSEGALLTFSIKNSDEKIDVFTTRPDTLYGATYMVLAPEHPLVGKFEELIENAEEVRTYQKEASKKDEIERTNAEKEKTGVELKGAKAINPGNGEEIPVWIADYVLASYGTGAIMAVPAHDERDGEFAKKFNLPIRPVVIKHFVLGGPDAMREGVETLTRDVVDVIIEHPEDGTFLVIKETDDTGRVHVHFVGGGTEGEPDEEAVRREVLEETGFADFDIIAGPFGINSCEGYRHPKKKNQLTKGGFCHIKLKNLKQQASEIDEGRHTVEWMTREDVTRELTWDGHIFGWGSFLHNHPYTDQGKLINSGEFDGMDSEVAKEAITKKVGGKITNTYKIRDWVFSRQRYWGEPIPIIHCESCGPVAVPEDQLPVTLPEVESYEPHGTGESPLAEIADWVNTTCPTCGKPGKRETNTMPQWAGSSWYYLRFMDPHNDDALVSKEKEKYWAPVDLYVGGDHAVRHLIYARFWHKFLYDIGVVSTIEPFQRLEFLGFILAEDGRKMSKRWGNVINPDDIVTQVGADTLRLYEMFMGPFENTIAWSQDGVVGVRRFLERVWGLKEHVTDTEPAHITSLLHKTIKKVRADIESFKFNTAVSASMIFLNAAEKDGLTEETYRTFITLIAPFAPHITEELWEREGLPFSIHTQPYPIFEEKLTADDVVTIAVQIDGKARGAVTVDRDATEEQAMAAVIADEQLKSRISGVERVIYVPNKIINILQRKP